MPAAGSTFLGSYLWLGGASTFLVAQAAAMTHLAASDPGSLTDAASPGGIAVTVAGMVIAGFQCARHLVPLFLEERQRARKDALARDSISYGAIDARVVTLEAAVARLQAGGPP